MKLIRMIECDLACGIRSEWWKFALFLAAILLHNISLLQKAIVYGEGGSSLTFGDYLANCLFGMDPVFIAPGQFFQLPGGWMLVILLACFSTLSYPCKNLRSIGQQLIASSGGRWIWWISKCFWVAAICGALIVAALVLTAAFVVATSGSCSMAVSASAMALMGSPQTAPLALEQSMAAFLLSFYLSLTALCLVQLAVSTLGNPIIGFASSVTILFFSCFFAEAFLLGNHLMAARSGAFVEHGFDPMYGTALSAMVCSASIVAGLALFDRKDLFEKARIHDSAS